MNDKSKIEALEAEVKALKDRIDPPPRPPSTHQPIDHTAWMTAANTMDRGLLQAMMAADDPAGRMADLGKPNPVTGYSTPQPASQGPRGSGWRDEVPITSPPGVALADQLMDEQDRLDKVALAEKLAAAEAAMKEATKKEAGNG